ncbi:MAG: hypothetical protein ACK40R_05710 [Thermomonas sp.]
MPASRKPAPRRLPPLRFVPTARHWWLAALGLLARVGRRSRDQSR